MMSKAKAEAAKTLAEKRAKDGKWKDAMHDYVDAVYEYVEAGMEGDAESTLTALLGLLQGQKSDDITVFNAESTGPAEKAKEWKKKAEDKQGKKAKTKGEGPSEEWVRAACLEVANAAIQDKTAASKTAYKFAGEAWARAADYFDKAEAAEGNTDAAEKKVEKALAKICRDFSTADIDKSKK